MSKEKNVQQPEPKKEKTSVLEKIRRRTGLLVGIVGLALVIFILESLLGSGASIFGGDELTTMGSINGRKIDRNEFVMKLENQLNNYRQRNQGQEVDENLRQQAVESIFQQYVVEHVMKPQFEKAGITVGEDEVYHNVVVEPAQSVIQNLTDPNTGKINEQFSRPDGTLDLLKWKQAVQNVTGESEMAVRQMEDLVKSSLYFSKFRTLVNKGLYYTSAEVKASAKQQVSTVDVAVAMKRFDAVTDSTIKLSDADLRKYYNDHTYLFSNPENTRKVEYVAFNVSPTPEDLDAIKKDAARAAEEFKGKTVAEDSAFMSQESENGNITIQSMDRKSMIVQDSGIYTAAPGAVFGPYNEGAYFKVYKLQAINSVADSARVRHILIGINDPQTQQQKKSMAQAKKEADSLLVLIKANTVSFDTLVTTISDDMGSKTNGGDYGWFDENKGFVEPFKNAGLMGTKGNISVVETQFGYHIIEVLDVSKTRHTSYRVAQIFKPIAPSDETNQKIFALASEFGGKNNTAELFDKAVAAEKLTPRMAEVKEGEYNIPGLEGTKELVKWAYTAEQGEVSVFSITGKHLAAKLTGIKNKGTLPYEDVIDDVRPLAIKDKKAEMFIAEFKSKAGSSQNIDDIATKVGGKAFKQNDFSATIGNVEGIGRDEVLAGTVAGLKPGAMSKPTAGDMGVFVATVGQPKTSAPPAEVGQHRTEMMQSLTGRTDYEIFTALKDMSDIDFHKSRID